MGLLNGEKWLSGLVLVVLSQTLLVENVDVEGLSCGGGVLKSPRDLVLGGLVRDRDWDQTSVDLGGVLDVLRVVAALKGELGDEGGLVVEEAVSGGERRGRVLWRLALGA